MVSLVVVLGAVSAAPARADVVHTVQPGETLSSIAAIDDVSQDSLAAANGLARDAGLVAGETLVIPGGSADSSSSAAAGGSSTVTAQAGDTLSGVAAMLGVSTEELAAANGMSIADPLSAGTVLSVPGGGESGGSSAGAPVATPGTVTSGEIGDIASDHDVSPALATAIAWQESGFDNSAVSSANARGVMQIIPSTWDFVQGSLATRQLDPFSPQDNVDAGVTYLDYLLSQSGDDPVTTVASYYQGLDSVRQEGLYADTRQYVDSVLGLRDSFGGG